MASRGNEGSQGRQEVCNAALEFESSKLVNMSHGH